MKLTGRYRTPWSISPSRVPSRTPTSKSVRWPTSSRIRNGCRRFRAFTCALGSRPTYSTTTCRGCTRTRFDDTSSSLSPTSLLRHGLRCTRARRVAQACADCAVLGNGSGRRAWARCGRRRLRRIGPTDAGALASSVQFLRSSRCFGAYELVRWQPSEARGPNLTSPLHYLAVAAQSECCDSLLSNLRRGLAGRARRKSCRSRF